MCLKCFLKYYYFLIHFLFFIRDRHSFTNDRQYKKTEMESFANNLLQYVIHQRHHQTFLTRLDSLMPILEHVASLDQDKNHFDLYLTGDVAQFLIGHFHSFFKIKFALVLRNKACCFENSAHILEKLIQLILNFFENYDICPTNSLVSVTRTSLQTLEHYV